MDAEQLTSIIQMIVTGGGAVAVMYLWIRALQEDIKYLRQQLEEAQKESKDSMRTQVEWMRYERLKDLPRDDTRPIPPRWDAAHPAARIED